MAKIQVSAVSKDEPIENMIDIVKREGGLSE